jgi:hypothetical protein
MSTRYRPFHHHGRMSPAAHFLFSAMVAGSAFIAPFPGPLAGQAAPPGGNRAASDSVASPDGHLHRVLLGNGTVYFGWIAQEGDPVRIQLTDGEVVEIARERVARIEPMRGTLEGGEFWPADPNASRLFFTPTGRNLPAGGGSFNAYYGLLPFAAVGITDRVTIAGGTPFFFGGDDGRLIYLAPKVQLVRKEGFQLATGVLALHYTAGPDRGTYLVYSVATVGSTPNSGVTAGIGLGRSDGRWSSHPALVLGADHRTSRRVKLMTENYLFPGGSSNSGLVSGGVRIMGERLAADLALAAPVGHGEGFVFPLVNFSVGW